MSKVKRKPGRPVKRKPPGADPRHGRARHEVTVTAAS